MTPKVEMVAQLGLKRGLYFLKDDQLFETHMRPVGDADNTPPKLVAAGPFQQEPTYSYFVDTHGDLVRIKDWYCECSIADHRDDQVMPTKARSLAAKDSIEQALREPGLLLQRYLNGEHVAVWEELLRHGDAIRREPLWSDALAVARETMKRARHNIELIEARLKQIGYRFEEPKQTVQGPSRHLMAAMNKFEEHVGPLPLSLRTFFEIVGPVNLLGEHPNWQRHAYPDPLIIVPELDNPEFALEEGLVAIAPDYRHKANVSGGGPYGMEVPNAAAEGPLLGEPHQTSFVGYLRACFRWGGFPGFHHCSNPPVQTLNFLSADLLPI